MTEILDAIRNMSPSAADLFLLACVAFGSGALGFALGIMYSYREDAKGDPTNQPTARRCERRKNRDRRDHDA